MICMWDIVGLVCSQGVARTVRMADFSSRLSTLSKNSKNPRTNSITKTSGFPLVWVLLSAQPKPETKRLVGQRSVTAESQRVWPQCPAHWAKWCSPLVRSRGCAFPQTGKTQRFSASSFILLRKTVFRWTLFANR